MLSSPIKTNTELKSSRRFCHDATISRLKRKTLSSSSNPLRKGKKKRSNCSRVLRFISQQQFCYAPFRVRFELAKQNQKWINRIPLIFKFTIKDFQNCLVASIDWLSALSRRRRGSRVPAGALVSLFQMRERSERDAGSRWDVNEHSLAVAVKQEKVASKPPSHFRSPLWWFCLPIKVWFNSVPLSLDIQLVTGPLWLRSGTNMGKLRPVKIFNLARGNWRNYMNSQSVIK